MVPPPITPNPHRFITSTSSIRPSAQQPGPPQPASSIAKKIAATPRFTFSSASRKIVDNVNPQSSPFEARRHFPTPAPPQKETIDEPSSGEDDADEGLRPQFHNNNNAISKTELHEEDPSSPPPTSAKRRRLTAPEKEQIVISSSPVASPPSSPLLRSSPLSPETPPPALHALLASNNYPRFRVPIHSSPPPASTKPTFVLPSAPKSPPSVHISSLLFSPQKRNQKFVPGGLAATVREWVVEASQSLYHSRHKSGEDWNVKFRVEEIKDLQGWNDSDSLVRAQTSEGIGNGKKWVLIGKGNGENPRFGDMVGIRKPVWDVDIGEDGDTEGWSVAVEWKIL